MDSDEDGVGNNADAFLQMARSGRIATGTGLETTLTRSSMTPSEWADSDVDGVGDNL